MFLEIKSYRRCPDGSFEQCQHQHVLFDVSLEAARRMAKATVESLPEVDRAEIINPNTDEVLFRWPQEAGNA